MKNELDLQIASGDITNAYEQFEFTLAAGATKEIFFVFNYFRLLEYSGAQDTLNISFGGSPLSSSFIGAGVGLKLPNALGRVVIKNTDSVANTVNIALAVGEVSDDRLTVSGVVQVDVTNTDLAVAEISPPTVVTKAYSLNAASTTLISEYTNTINQIIQASHNNTDGVYIAWSGGLATTQSNGMVLYAGDSMEVKTSDIFYGLSISGTQEVRVLTTRSV